MPGCFDIHFRGGAAALTTVELIYNTLCEQDGTAYVTGGSAAPSPSSSIVAIENWASARALAALYDNSERAGNQYNPNSMGVSIPRWNAILGIISSPNQSIAAMQAIIAAKLALVSQPPTQQGVYDMVKLLLGPIFVDLEFFSPNQDYGSVPAAQGNITGIAGHNTITGVGTTFFTYFSGTNQEFVVVDNSGITQTFTVSSVASNVVLTIIGTIPNNITGQQYVGQSYPGGFLSIGNWTSPLNTIKIRVWQPRDNQGNLLMSNSMFQQTVNTYQTFLTNYLPTYVNFQTFQYQNNTANNSGKMTFAAESIYVSGAGTSFTTTFTAGSSFEIVDDKNQLQTYVVSSVISNVAMILTTTTVNSATGLSYRSTGFFFDVSNNLDSQQF